MIGARPYLDTDYEAVSQWWAKHGEKPPAENMYPVRGFIVENVAAAFMYETDSAISLLEMIIYNPAAPKDTRQKALDEVIEAVILQARGLGYEVLAGFTDMPVVVERSKKFGFVPRGTGHTMVTKEL